jgi:hypothetical protein
MTTNSPLFKNASKMIRQEAAKAFRATQVARSMNRAAKSNGGGSSLTKALNAFARGMHTGLSTLAGSTVGQVARQVGHYSQSGTPAQKRLMQSFLKSLGPVGDLLGMISSGGRAPSITNAVQLATKLLQAMGHEISPTGSSQRSRRPVLAARDFLASMGGQFDEIPGEDQQAENPPPRQDQTEVPMAGGGSGKYPPQHPIVTGEMQPAPESKNVYSYGYSSDSGNLYVRFRSEDTGGPGSLYRYSDVTPEEFMGLMAVTSKGGWVWDNLRIRGTISGHQKDYALVGIIGGYVPRKATVGPLMRAGAGWRMAGSGETPDYMGAIYLPRNKLTTQRNWVTSIRPLSPAFGGLDSGGGGYQPNRGTPNNGAPRRPNRG